jgi:hypothetical protein
MDHHDSSLARLEFLNPEVTSLRLESPLSSNMSPPPKLLHEVGKLDSELISHISSENFNPFSAFKANDRNCKLRLTKRLKIDFKNLHMNIFAGVKF